jgi:hypothetical protein
MKHNKHTKQHPHAQPASPAAASTTATTTSRAPQVRENHLSLKVDSKQHWSVLYDL